MPGREWAAAAQDRAGMSQRTRRGWGRRRRFRVWNGQGWKDEVRQPGLVRIDDGYTYAMCFDCLTERRGDDYVQVPVYSGWR
jgi:hypothetical protein